MLKEKQVLNLLKLRANTELSSFVKLKHYKAIMRGFFWERSRLIG